MSEDEIYENEIAEANRIGNALLSGLISDGIADNKKNIKLSGSLKTLGDSVETYKNEVAKLKSLRVASCYDILEMKKNSDYEIQIGVAGKLLKKIYDILESHVKHNESKVISKEEIKSLQDQTLLLNSIQTELLKLPEPHESLKEQLKLIDTIQLNLDKITGTIVSSRSKISKLQNDVIANTSDVLFYST